MHCSCIVYFLLLASQENPEKCSSALGPGSKENPDSAFSASSSYNAYTPPSHALLNTKKASGAGAWCSKTNVRGQWIQIDFKRVVKITRLASQGRDDANQWVKSYTIQYGLTKYFEDYNKGVIYPANSDRHTVIGNVLEPPIIARYIRVLPQTWYGHMSMRLQFYGCIKGITKQILFPFRLPFSLSTNIKLHS